MEKPAASLEYAAYIPCYNDGNSVLAVMSNGSTAIIKRSIRSQLNILPKEHNIDIRSLRKNFSVSIGRFNLIPIPLSLDTILIPVKIRKVIAVNDGRHAYIVLSHIKQVTGGQYAVIKLYSGYEINSIESLRNVKNKIRLGNLVREKFASSVLGDYSLKEGISAIGAEYTKPATKGDLCMLAYEMMKLRKIFERRGGDWIKEEGEKG